MTTTTARLTLASLKREMDSRFEVLAEAQATQTRLLETLVAGMTPAEPASTVTPAPAKKAAQAPTKTLTRKAWQDLRRTKGGTVRKAFAGLTREQAFEAGLCEGFTLPTGDLRKALKSA